MPVNHRLAAIVAALLGAAIASCASPKGDAEPTPGDSPPIEVELFRLLSQRHQDYVVALQLCSSTRPLDWVEARRRLELTRPYRVFDEDPELIRKFLAGDDAARIELGRRGLILNSLMDFTKGYDKRKWDEALKVLLDAGQPGQILLSTTLVEMLMNGQFRGDWDHIRAALYETGPVALETVIGWARELVVRTPAATAIYRSDDLVGAGVALIWFGEKGLPVLEELAKSPKPNVRRGCARAIGESVNGGDGRVIQVALACVPILVKLVSEDPDWPVRATAGESLGRMSGAKAAAGRALVDRMKKEPERVVRQAIIQSIGELRYEESVPSLMLMLEVPSVETTNQVMNALYHVTGERLTRKEQWLHWYATEYARWKERPRRP
jgi:HEAT repeat protein